jgi:D-proline reductase (dithiol) PrdB
VQTVWNKINMASIFKLDNLYRFFMRAYPIKSYGTPPNAPLHKELNRCRVALITTAGLHLQEQTPYDDRIIGGDCSYREIPNTIETQVLALGHRSKAFDSSGTESDINLVFPLDRFRELENEGKIGSLNDRHFSFMGSITKPKPLIEKTAPEVGHKLKADDVDVAFLTPV